MGLAHIDVSRVLRKVRQKIPDLLRENGIHLQEAKDYVRIYLTCMRLGMSPAVFAGKLLEHADEQEVKRVFDSLIAATRFVVGEGDQV